MFERFNMSTTSKYTRYDLATMIYDSLARNIDQLKNQWKNGTDKINYFYLDEILPEEVLLDIKDAFPSNTDNMFLRKSLRELKFVAAQMDKYNPLLEEIIYAFQDERIVNLIGEITNLSALEPDTLLYAGGISMMAKNHFLNPHIDNSHDKYRQRYRVANLLFYIAPNWQLQNGDNLELWPDGPTKKQITIENKFNRLVVMITNGKSWHSVSKVCVNQIRCCVSNF